jgi:hypothetical protein
MIKTTSTPVLFRPWDETQSDQNQDLLLAPFADMSQRGRSAETPLITDMSQRGRSAETPLITSHVRVTQCITNENVTNLLCMLQAI